MRFFWGLVVGIILVPLALFCYFLLGLAPAATGAPAMPFEHFLASSALNARIHREMPKTVPIPTNDENLAAGAKIYVDDCAVCHGLPSKPITPIGKGMYPKVPQLWVHGVTDDPPGETYWKVSNGIRLTGMPGFNGSLNDNQMWQVTLLLANADKLSPQVKGILNSAPQPVAQPTGSGNMPRPGR